MIEIKKQNLLHLVISCLLVVITITPMFSARVPMIVIMILDLVWVGIAIIQNHYRVLMRPSTVLSLILLVLVFLYKVIGVSSAEWGNYAIQLYFYSAIWMMVYIKNEYSSEEKHKLARICYIAFLLNIFSNIYMFYMLGRYTSWSFVGASKQEEYVRLYNLGATSFVSSVTLFSGISFSLFVNSKGQKGRMLYGIGAGLSLFYIIICSGRATALIQLILMFVLFFLYRNQRTSNIVPLLVMVLAAFAFMFRIEIVNAIAHIIPNQRVAVRINAIAQFLSGDDVEGGYFSRIQIIALDFKTWLNDIGSFLFGIGDHRYQAGHLSEIYTIGISGHSDYFDFLAKYGIIGFTLLNMLFMSLFKFFKNTRTVLTKFSRYILIVLVCFFVRSIVGSIFSMDIASTMFIFVPTSIFILRRETSEDGYN